MPEAKRARTESASEDVWTSTLDYRTKYGYCRYSISAQIEVVSSDGAYIPFKVRPGKRGETEIHIVVNDRIIAAVERIEEFAKNKPWLNPAYGLRSHRMGSARSSNRR